MLFFLEYKGCCLKFFIWVVVMIFFEMLVNFVFKLVRIFLVNCLVFVVWKFFVEMLLFVGLFLYVEVLG